MSRLLALTALLAASAGGVLLRPASPLPVAEPPAQVRVAFDGRQAVAEVDPRFLSFAVDTAQVVGGEFWAPAGRGEGLLDTGPVARYDFGRPGLRRLAAALGPAYLRIGGTDADKTSYYLGDGPTPPPSRGARWVLTRRRWDEVTSFARSADLRLVFTLNAGPAARDGNGDWDPESARPLVRYARDRGDPVEVWELGNEVNVFPVMHGIWLSPERYAHDVARARSLLDGLDAPGRLAGPSSAFWPVLGEVRSFSEPLLRRAGRLLDVVSWHYYPQQSHRCPVATRRAIPGHLLAPDELDDVDRWAGEVEAAARAQAPDAEVWLGETGGAQCGGEPGLSDAFADALWWVDELGRVARRGHKVVVRQTLSGSDYGLVDDATLTPNPSYWASWLWRGLMGTRVLAARTEPAAPALRVYAHCARDAGPGAVTVLLVNLDPRVTVTAALGGAAVVYQLDGESLGARTARLGGVALRPGPDGGPPPLASLTPAAGSGEVPVPPLSIVYAVLPGAGATACQ